MIATLRLILRLAINAIALVVATWLLSGISVSGSSTSENALTIIGVAAIFGVVNAIVRPIVTLLGLPFIVLTLGLLLLVINALMLMLTSWLAGVLGLPFDVDGFWTALLGSIILSIVSGILGWVFPSVSKD